MGWRKTALTKSSWSAVTAIILLLMIGIAAIFVRHLMKDDRVVLLCPDGNAKWIRGDEPFDVAAKRSASTHTVFATTLKILNPSVSGNLELIALRQVVIDLDGRVIFDSGPDLTKWKTVYTVAIPRDLSVGTHQLRCTVSNQNGPSLLRLKCTSPVIASDASWQATTDPLRWKAAATADELWEPLVAEAVDARARDMPPILLCATIFVAVGLIATLRTYGSSSQMRASRLRWCLITVWIAMSLNNLFKVPIACGYDAQSHYEYILYVTDHWALPKPDAGWQFFQAPLYYILSAGFCRILIASGLPHEAILILLRLIPLACGGVMIEICYRASRIVHPSRGDLQMIATAVGGMAPVNLYMSQTVSNEPLAAVFSGVIFLILLRWLTHPQLVRSAKTLAIAGVILGFAWVTKINTLLWIVPVFAAIVMALKSKQTRVLRDMPPSLSHNPNQMRCEGNVLAASHPALQIVSEPAFAAISHFLGGVAVVVAIALTICGPYIVHNLLLSGRPFYIEYPVSAARWWQDPGYRTLKSFFEFGHVFARPVYNGTQSVWDSLYGTFWGKGIPSGQEPWNFRYMWCGLWLAIIPSVLILAGMIRSFCLKEQPIVRNSLRLSTLIVASFVAAILYVYLRLPIFSCAKASYMLGTLPCAGLLAAAGFDCVSSNRWMRAVTAAAVTGWAAIAYMTFIAI